jgi:hypothetical protein
VTPELAVKTSRQSPNSFGLGLSFGAQIAQMRLYYTALQYYDVIGTKNQEAKMGLARAPGHYD